MVKLQNIQSIYINFEIYEENIEFACGTNFRTAKNDTKKNKLVITTNLSAFLYIDIYRFEVTTYIPILFATQTQLYKTQNI